MTDAGSDRAYESLNGWWHTWLDEAVDWEREMPLSPGTRARDLPLRAPSVGWDGMEWGMESTRVPGTLDQARPGYRGVAWQWRPIVIPEAWRGRLVHLTFGGARQQTEVYLDERLVGHDLDGLTPFSVDLTPYVRLGGQHELALRITNPGGWREGKEGGPIRWGRAMLPGSRDLGGLWGGVAMVALPRVYVAGLFAVSDEAGGEVSIRVTLCNAGDPGVAEVRATALDAHGHPAAASAEARVVVAVGEEMVVTLPVRIPQPRAWSPEGPYFYHLVAEARSDHGLDRAEASMGWRRVEERDGVLNLNGKPLPVPPVVDVDPAEGPVLPNPMEAERQVAAALAEGAGALVARGWPVAPQVPDAADRMGLPVIQDLVGVEDPAEVPTEARALYAELARDRLRRIIRRDRNHPSVVAWRLPMTPDTPAYAEYARLARKVDPTRPVLATPARTASAP